MAPNADVRRAVAALVLCLLVVTAGCAGAGDADASARTQTETTAASPTDGASTVASTDAASTPPPGLESVLYDLVRASDRPTFADRHDLTYRDGAVLVVVELRDGESLPDGYAVDVVDRRDGVVAAYVPVDSLVELADEPAVEYVRTPRRAVPSDLSHP